MDGTEVSQEQPESKESQPPNNLPAAPPGGTDGPPHPSPHVHAHHSAIHFRFLEQLKHRNIIRVGILYLVTCRLVLEPVHVVFHMLEVPVWANRLVVILMAIGFPAALLFAWVYEITPEGLQPTANVDPQRSMRKLTARRLDRAIIGVLLLAIAYLVVDKFRVPDQATKGEYEATTSSPLTAPTAARSNSVSAPVVPDISNKSVAVLPFVDMSEKKDQEYFADGMAEEILDLLAKIPGLKVIGRTSSFAFKSQSVDLRTIGTTLGATYVLEGSVRKSLDRARVTAQLVDARDGAHLWSETYDRDVGDVLKMENEIATALVRALQVTMASASRLPGTITNVEAYNLYLQGRHELDRSDAEGFAQAENDFNQAIERDPQFAAAWAWLAFTYDFQGEFGFVPPAAAFEKARLAAKTAARLDPNIPVTYAVMAGIHCVYDWDWAAAEKDVKEGLAIAPHDALVVMNAGRVGLVLGRLDSALAQYSEGLRRDPLSPIALLGIAAVQLHLGHFAEAEAAARKMLAAAPTYTGAHFLLGLTLLMRGDHEAALAEMKKESVDGGQIEGFALAYSALGRKSESDAALVQMLREQANGNAFGIAEVYAFRGESDQAFQWLDRAYAQKDVSLFYLKDHPTFRRLFGDARFSAFLRKMHLPE
jgi:adenylate cyclase